MQCDVCGGVIYISNKSKYLKTKERYTQAVKNNLYNFKSSFKQEGFLKIKNFHFIHPLNFSRFQRNKQRLSSTMLGPVHAETFSCVFVLFQVMSWLFSIPLKTVNNTKTQKNVFVCTGP